MKRQEKQKLAQSIAMNVDDKGEVQKYSQVSDLSDEVYNSPRKVIQAEVQTSAASGGRWEEERQLLIPILIS